MTTDTVETHTLRFGAGAARILFSRARSRSGQAVVEVAMPEGAMPPLHAHVEDETVHVLEGRVTFFVGDERIEAGPRTKVVLPAGVPHTYRVERCGRARWLVVTASARLERFIRAVGRPAAEAAPAHPRVTDGVAFTVAAAEHGISVLGPAGTLPEAGRSPRRRRRRRARSVVPALA